MNIETYRLTSLFYVLGRDHLPLGAIEEIFLKHLLPLLEEGGKKPIFSNKHLAAWAEEKAEQLAGTPLKEALRSSDHQLLWNPTNLDHPEWLRDSLRIWPDEETVALGTTDEMLSRAWKRIIDDPPLAQEPTEVYKRGPYEARLYKDGWISVACQEEHNFHYEIRRRRRPQKEGT